MNPAFTLAPWELPPDCDAPLSAPADFVFRSFWQYGFGFARLRETEIHLRVIPYKDAFLQFFCDGERPQNGNWLLSYTTHFPLVDTPWDSEILDSNFRKNDDLWYESIMRLLFVEGTPYGFKGPHCITVSPGGSCHFQFGTPTRDASNEWQSAQIDSLFTAGTCPLRSVTTKNQLLTALNDEHSHARFALRWLHLEPQERQRQLQEFEREKLIPMRTLLKAVLHTQSGIWDEGTPLLWQTRELTVQEIYRARGSDWDGNQLVTVVQHSPQNFKTVNIPPRLKKWKTAIWNFYIASPNDRWLLYTQMERLGEWGAEVKVAPPTAHERIEAQLRLRQWWQETYTPPLFESEDAGP